MRLFPHLLISSAVAFLTIASSAHAQTDFGQIAVGSSAKSTVTITFSAAATINSISVVTQGASGLDFTNAGTGTCAAQTSYTAGQTCTLDITFQPTVTGERYGEALLKDASDNLIATAFLEGNGTGPQIAYNPGTAIAINPSVNGSSLSLPSGVAIDGSGNLYIADDNNNRIVEVTPVGLATAFNPIVNGSGLRTPRGVAVDAAGDLFVSDLDSNRIMEVPAGGSPATAFDPVVNGIGLHYPCGLVTDGAGNLFIADVDNGRVLEVPAGNGAVVSMDPEVNGTGLSYPVNLALDAAGDLFISDQFGNRVVEVPAGGGTPIGIDPTVNGAALTEPYGVAVDAAGDLFIADSGNNRIIEVPTGGAPAFAINPIVDGKGLNDPIGIALDGAGDLFIADSVNNRVVELQRSQPPVLSFAATSPGTSSSDSPQTVQLQNAGNTSLTFPAPALGNNPLISTGFTLDSSGASACPLVPSGSSTPGALAAGASCLLPISFQPGSSGSVSGALTLTDNNLNAAAPSYAVQTIPLFGDSPLVTLSASSLSFGPQAIGTSSAAQQVTLTNSGAAPLSITSIGLIGSNSSAFTLQNTCGSTLSAGASCTVEGQFTPSAFGSTTEEVAITDNASGSPHTVTLFGIGVYPATLTVTPSATSITTQQALTVTVSVSGGGSGTNPPPSGSITLTIGSYVSAPAVLSNDSTSVTIPAGSLAAGSDNISAVYTPDAAGSLTYASSSGSSSVDVTASSNPTVMPPAAATGKVSALTATSVTIGGTVNPNGADTHYWFLYGTSSTLSGATQTASVDLGSGTTPQSVTANITTLSASTMYFYQLVAQNSAGTTSGTIYSFTTTSAPYVSINGSSLTVTPGATSGNTLPLTLTPWYGFTGTVNLSCQITTAPANASDPPTCSIQPASLTIAGSASQQTVLTITTTAATASNRPLKLPWSSTGKAVLACLFVFCIPAGRSRWKPMLALLLFCCIASGLGCSGASSGSGNTGGGGTQTNPGTTAGSYVVTVNGTSDAGNASTTIALTVQ